MRFKMIYARAPLFNAVSSYTQTVFPRLLSLPLSRRARFDTPITYPRIPAAFSIESFQEWKVKGYIFFFFLRIWMKKDRKIFGNRIYLVAFQGILNYFSFIYIYINIEIELNFFYFLIISTSFKKSRIELMKVKKKGSEKQVSIFLFCRCFVSFCDIYNCKLYIRARCKLTVWYKCY